MFARVSSATDGWLLAGGDEMRSPPVTRPPGLHTGLLHIHNCERNSLTLRVEIKYFDWVKVFW